jgi:hypothetical protein
VFQKQLRKTDTKKHWNTNYSAEFARVHRRRPVARPEKSKEQQQLLHSNAPMDYTTTNKVAYQEFQIHASPPKTTSTQRAKLPFVGRSAYQ